MKVICDECRAEFEVKFQKQTKQAGEEEITRLFFECPVCHAQHTVSFLNEKTEQIKEQIARNRSNNFEGIKKKQSRLKREIVRIEKLWKEGK